MENSHNVTTTRMDPAPLDNTSHKKIFGLFVIIYTLLYCLVPYFVSITIWPDSAQIYSWSQNFQWGYHEHPWFPPFVFKIFTVLSNYSPIAIFLIGATLNLLACWAVWRLGRKILSPELALLSALLLSSYLMMSFFLGMVNNNTFNFGLWPVMYLCFYNAVKTQELKYWIAVGIVAGLSTLSKYYTLFPLMCMAAFILLDNEARKSFFHKGIYLSAVVFLLVLMPHIFWLMDNDYITIKYALNRSQGEQQQSFGSQLFLTMVFAAEQLANFIIPLVIFAGLYLFCPRYEKSEAGTSSFNKRFVFLLGAGPFLLTLLLSLIFKWHLASEWGQALPCLWSLLLLTWLQPKISRSTFAWMLRIIYASLFFTIIAAIYMLYFGFHRDIALNYPAATIANYIDEQWAKRYRGPLKYIISSDEYISGAVSLYSVWHPYVYTTCSGCINAVKKSDIKKYGAMIVLTDQYVGKTDIAHESAQIQKEFPGVVILPVHYFEQHRAKKDTRHLEAWVAVLPPTSANRLDSIT